MRAGWPRRRRPATGIQQRQPSTAALLVLLQLFGLCLPCHGQPVGAQSGPYQQTWQEQNWQQQQQQEEQWADYTSQLRASHSSPAPAQASPNVADTARRSLAQVTAGPQVMPCIESKSEHVDRVATDKGVMWARFPWLWAEPWLCHHQHMMMGAETNLAFELNDLDWMGPSSTRPLNLMSFPVCMSPERR